MAELRALLRLTGSAVLVVAVVCGMTAAPAGAAPVLKIIPTPTSPSHGVTAFGSGFCGAPGCSRVEVSIGNQHVGTAAVAPDGSFNLVFVAPSIPDQYMVVAEQAGSPNRRATTGLLVTPHDTPPTNGRTVTTAVPVTSAPLSTFTAPLPPKRISNSGAPTTTEPKHSTTTVDSATSSIPRGARSAPVAESRRGGAPLWPWIVVAVAIALAAGGAVARRQVANRRSS